MTLKQLEAFYLAARLGTFALAAARIHVTQSSLSKRIAELEKGGGTTKLPTDQEVDRMMDVFGKMFDRFLDFAREMDEKTKDGTSL